MTRGPRLGTKAGAETGRFWPKPFQKMLKFPAALPLSAKRDEVHLRIKNSWLEGDTVDPDLEFAKYWEPEDLVDPRAPAPPPAPNQALIDITENAFHAYSEPWEAALLILIISEDTDPAARFRLKTKYEGVVLREETE